MSEVMKKHVFSRADRPLSFRVSDYDIPQGSEEEWRFTPVERISDFFADSACGKAPAVQVRGDAVYERASRTDPRLGKIIGPEDRTGALAWESFTDAHVITVPKNTHPEKEIMVGVRGEGESAVAGMHILIAAEEFSEATVIINHEGSARLTEGIEILAEEGSHLTVVTVQDWDDSAAHMLSNRIRVGRNASFRHIVVTLGGNTVRVTTSVDFADSGADVNLLGAYFVDAGQHLEHRLFVDHSIAKCRSNVTYKGALQGQDAHSVWVGDVLIGAKAEGSSSYELNRNLVLTPGARADSVPNLEIKTGEIEGAGHASATGRFDDEQLFYLKSRGIPEREAKRLVVRGFFAELISQIGVPSVQQHLMQAIEEELQRTMEGENA